MNKNPATPRDGRGRPERESQIDRLNRRSAHKPLAITARLFARINTGRREYTAG